MVSAKNSLTQKKSHDKIFLANKNGYVLRYVVKFYIAQIWVLNRNHYEKGEIV